MKYVLVMIFLYWNSSVGWYEKRIEIETPSMEDCVHLRDQKNITEGSGSAYRYIGGFCEERP